ncbi:MAG: lipoyl(octanoyl) transferase LipB [Anaerolineales bacterium]|nr:lipoyl(octanoyl) transferase LipB [Anaerolineales bacterium]
MTLTIQDLGLIDYQSARTLQEEYAAQIADGTRPPTLLLLEHPHVYTFGRKGRAENLIWDEAQLKQKGISTYWVDRGGDVTYHGPGQLVGYPLIPLNPLSQNQKTDYVGYVRKIEETLISVLMSYGLAGAQRAGKSGVWLQADVHSRCVHCAPEDRKRPAKIAAIGVKVDANGVTRHGFSLNVSPDMDYWQGIVPCGLSEPVVSLADVLPAAPPMDDVKRRVGEAFGAMVESAYLAPLRPN